MSATGDSEGSSRSQSPVYSQRRLRRIFDTCDPNHDGRLNKREVIKAIRSHPEVADFFRLPQRIRQEDGSRAMFEAFFQSIDANDDREINWAEFLEFYVHRGAVSGTEDDDEEVEVLSPVPVTPSRAADDMPPAPPPRTLSPFSPRSSPCPALLPPPARSATWDRPEGRPSPVSRSTSAPALTAAVRPRVDTRQTAQVQPQADSNADPPWLTAARREDDHRAAAHAQVAAAASSSLAGRAATTASPPRRLAALAAVEEVPVTSVVPFAAEAPRSRPAPAPPPRVGQTSVRELLWQDPGELLRLQAEEAELRGDVLLFERELRRAERREARAREEVEAQHFLALERSLLGLAAIVRHERAAEASALAAAAELRERAVELSGDCGALLMEAAAEDQRGTEEVATAHAALVVSLPPSHPARQAATLDEALWHLEAGLAPVVAALHPPFEGTPDRLRQEVEGLERQVQAYESEAERTFARAHLVTEEVQAAKAELTDLEDSVLEVSILRRENALLRRHQAEWERSQLRMVRLVEDLHVQHMRGAQAQAGAAARVAELQRELLLAETAVAAGPAGPQLEDSRLQSRGLRQWQGQVAPMPFSAENGWAEDGATAYPPSP